MLANPLPEKRSGSSLLQQRGFALLLRLFLILLAQQSFPLLRGWVGESSALLKASGLAGFLIAPQPALAQGCAGLQAPTNLQLTPTSGGFTVRWTAPSDANRDSWYLDYRKTPAGTLSNATISDASATSYTLSGLDAGVEYQVRISAQTSVSTCPPSDWATATASTLGAPAATSLLTGYEGNEQVTLSWYYVAANPPITKWQYQQKAGAGSYGSWTDIPSSRPNTLRHVVTGLTNDTAYKFKVRAVNSSGNGAASSETPSLTPTAGTKTITLSSNPANGRITEGDSGKKDIELTVTLGENAPTGGLLVNVTLFSIGTIVSAPLMGVTMISV